MQTKWYERFSQKISDLFPSQSPLVTAQTLARLNPDHIEVENVRSIMDVSYAAARQICEAAVRKGLFLPKIAIVCPDDNIARIVDAAEALPPTVKCWDGGEPQEINTTELQKREFYVLNER